MLIFRKDKKRELLKGLKQKELAEKLGISRTNLCNVLNGVTSASKVMAYCLVKECDENKEIDYYFERK